MSQQLALSSLFSVIALASLCLMSINGGFGDRSGSAGAFEPFAIQAELAPGLID